MDELDDVGIEGVAAGGEDGAVIGGGDEAVRFVLVGDGVVDLLGVVWWDEAVVLAVDDHDGDLDGLGVGDGAGEVGVESGAPSGVLQDDVAKGADGDGEFSIGVFFDELIEVGERGDRDAGAEAGFAGEGLEDDGASQ